MKKQTTNQTFKVGQLVLACDGGSIKNGKLDPDKGEWIDGIVTRQWPEGHQHAGEYLVEGIDPNDGEKLSCTYPASYLKPSQASRDDHKHLLLTLGMIPEHYLDK